VGLATFPLGLPAPSAAASAGLGPAHRRTFSALVERTLDGVEGGASQRFSRMSPRRRLAALHGWRYGRREEMRGLAYDAVAIASSPFGPPPFANAPTTDL
jgi:hypothetical protein